jgi:acetyltransferase-like isoleucine patch superfamily enzyme
MSLLADLRKTAALWAQDPALIWPTLQRITGYARAELVLRGCYTGDRVTVQGPLELTNHGRVEIGDHVYFLPGVLATHIAVAKGAVLSISASTGFNCGARLEAREHIAIGAHCMFASRVSVCDAKGAPITIEDGVWVAHGATICPGVRIGAGSAVSAGTIVTRDVPPLHLAIGSPARNVRLETLSRTR